MWAETHAIITTRTGSDLNNGYLKGTKYNFFSLPGTEITSRDELQSFQLWWLEVDIANTCELIENTQITKTF